MNRTELDKQFRDSFYGIDDNKNKAFVILVNGKRVKLRSNKAIWTSTGAAKNALNNHLNSLSYSYAYGERKEFKEAMKDWIKHNINVVSIAEYEQIQSQLKKA